MESYKEMKKLYEEHAPENFELEDTGSSYMLVHRKSSLSLELPSMLEREATTGVNLTARFFGQESPEAILEEIQSLIRRRDFLRERGYGPGEQFKEYGDGVEYVYNVPTESLGSLVRLIRDFGEAGNKK